MLAKCQGMLVQIKMTPAVSKSFRAVLPGMTCDQVALLRRYSADNFAASAVFDESGDVIWLATRDRTRSAAAHRRSARAVLAKLRIPTAGLKGAWLVLATEEAVRAAAVAQSCCAATGNHHHQETSHGAANESSSTPREDGEAKVILFGRQARGAGKLSFEVMR